MYRIVTPFESKKASVRSALSALLACSLADAAPSSTTTANCLAANRCEYICRSARIGSCRFNIQQRPLCVANGRRTGDVGNPNKRNRANYTNHATHAGRLEPGG